MHTFDLVRSAKFHVYAYACAYVHMYVHTVNVLIGHAPTSGESGNICTYVCMYVCEYMYIYIPTVCL